MAWGCLWCLIDDQWIYWHILNISLCGYINSHHKIVYDRIILAITSRLGMPSVISLNSKCRGFAASPCVSGNFNPCMYPLFPWTRTSKRWMNSCTSMGSVHWQRDNMKHKKGSGVCRISRERLHLTGQIRNQFANSWAIENPDPVEGRFCKRNPSVTLIEWRISRLWDGPVSGISWTFRELLPEPIHQHVHRWGLTWRSTKHQETGCEQTEIWHNPGMSSRSLCNYHKPSSLRKNNILICSRFSLWTLMVFWNLLELLALSRAPSYRRKPEQQQNWKSQPLER